MKMYNLTTAIAISASLLLVQACSSSIQSEQKLTANHDSHAGHSPDEVNPHAGHNMANAQNSEIIEVFQSKLTVPENIPANNSVPLSINIQDSTGKAITNFDSFQTKLMHLIVVSDDLQFFSHLHPDYKGNGQFKVEKKFPKPGNYTFFSDYKPTGKQEQVSVMKTQVSGKSSSPIEAVSLNNTKILGDTKVDFSFSANPLKVGKEVKLLFDIKDASNNQPIKDLQPYLGEKGHLVILRQSSLLTAADYIHAHAMKDTAANQVFFITQFPQPGKYKLWGQFNRNGKVVTADFWVNVI